MMNFGYRLVFNELSIIRIHWRRTYSDANQMVLQPMSKNKEDEREFGVFFEDEYNYLQHLKDRSQVEHDWSEADR